MATTLVEHAEKFRRDKARLDEREMALKERQRKARTRTLISAGGLVEKAGLLDLEQAALYGALLSLESGASDKKTVERWTRAGQEMLVRETADREKKREPLMITYGTPPPGMLIAELKRAGFRLNRLFGRWEGLADPEDAGRLAAANNGEVRRADGSTVSVIEARAAAE
jgi:hypothetical protein